MLAQTGEHPFAGGHQTDEVEADESAENAQQDGGGDTLPLPLGIEGEMEEGVAAHQDIGEAGGGDAGDEDGHERRHRQVDHEHLEGEHHACHGRLEDAGDGGGGAASHEHHHRLAVELEHLSEVAAYRRTREYDRCLGSHTAAETDGDGGGDDRAPCVVALQSALFAADGIENTGDAVADVVLDDVFHEERRQVDADDGEDEVEPVERLDVEAGGEQPFYLADETVENKGGKGGEKSHHECQCQGKLPVRDILLAPIVQPVNHVWSFGGLVVWSFGEESRSLGV